MLIKKSENIGTTFIGLICTAFKCEQSEVGFEPFMQHAACGCGTIEVLGKAHDWFDRGDSIEFIEAR